MDSAIPSEPSPGTPADVENIVSDDDSDLLGGVGDGEVTANQASVPELPAKSAGAGEDELDFEVEDDDGEIEDGEAISDDDAPAVATKEAPIASEKKKDGEDGELNSEDELEEGEVKEDDEEPEPAAAEGEVKPKSVCRFYGSGKCTWGDSCRFSHDVPDAPRGKDRRDNRDRNYGYGRNAGPPPAQHMRMPPHRGGPDYYPMPPPPHMGHGPPPPPLPPHAMAESSWERGMRSAKEMIAKASKRKEQEPDFEDKKFNVGVDEEDPAYPPMRHHRSRSRSPSPRRRSPSPYYHPHPRDQRPRDRPREPRERDPRDREPQWDSEYDRRRRLAFESNPWNDDAAPASPRHRPGGAEHYRDPWRRSKSPSGRPDRRPGGSDFRGREGPAKERSDSMSSISGSESPSLSGSSDLSGSDSSLDSPKNGATKPARPPRPHHNRPVPRPDALKGIIPDTSRLPRIPKLNRSGQQDARPKTKPEYRVDKAAPSKGRKDTWSGASSPSEHSKSSGSDSDRGRHHRRAKDVTGKRGSAVERSGKRRADEGDVRRDPAVVDAKRQRPQGENRSRSRGSPGQSPIHGSPVSRHSFSPFGDSPQRNSKDAGFSMKFNKKVNVLKETGVPEKLNGGLGDSEEEDASTERAARSGSESPGVKEDSLSPASRELAGSPSENAALGESEGVSSTTGSTRKKHLLKQLQEIEAAIARKKKTSTY